MSFRPSRYPCPKTEPHAEHQHNEGPDAYTYICSGDGVITIAFRWWETRAAVVPPEPWWTIEDGGGWPPFWDYAINPPEQPRIGAARRPWPSEWSRRPHP